MDLSAADGLLPLLLLVVFALAVVVGMGGAVRQWSTDRRAGADLQVLLRRDRTLSVTGTPAGMDASLLAGTFDATPRGDRRWWLQHPVTGPLTVQLPDGPAQLECATFRWWYEVAQRTRSRYGTRTQHVRLSTLVTLVRIPARIPQRIAVRPETVLGQVGLTRGGHQLESSEFNRRFRVEAADRALATTLLDAGMQRLLTERHRGRSVELLDELLVVGGEPDHDDPTLAGYAGQVPALRQDAQRLVGTVPAAFWRATEGSPPGGTP